MLFFINVHYKKEIEICAETISYWKLVKNCLVYSKYILLCFEVLIYNILICFY